MGRQMIIEPVVIRFITLGLTVEPFPAASSTLRLLAMTMPPRVVTAIWFPMAFLTQMPF